MDIPYFGSNIKPAIYDINDSNSFDLVVGLSTGGFLHYTMSRFGDINFDNFIDVSDILLIINEILYPENQDVECNSDANHDTNLDIFDILLILNIILED